MPKVLITGSNGFCGKYLADNLLQRENFQIFGLDIHRQSNLASLHFEYLQSDITEAKQIAAIVGKIEPDFIFHLAGIVNGSPADVYRINFLGSVNLLEAVLALKPDACVLIVGSAAEYGHIDKNRLPVDEEYPCKPLAPYGMSKYFTTLTAQDYVKRLGLKIVIARPFNIIGAGITANYIAGALLKRAKAALQSGNAVVRIGNLDSQRDFISAVDLAEAYYRLISGGFWGEIFNICSGKPYSIRFIAEKLLANSAVPIRLEFDPALGRASEVDFAYGSNAKTSRLLNFEPKIGIEQMLKEAWDYEMKAGVV